MDYSGFPIFLELILVTSELLLGVPGLLLAAPGPSWTLLERSWLFFDAQNPLILFTIGRSFLPIGFGSALGTNSSSKNPSS